jgi:hypothetical protein
MDSVGATMRASECRVGCSVSRRFPHYGAKLREKRLGPGPIAERGERAKHVLFADGESSADGVGVHTNSLELLQQMREPVGL